MKHIAIFASGEGTNAINIIEFFRLNKIPATFSVLSDRKNAPVIEKALAKGINTLVFSGADFYQGNNVLDYLEKNRTDLIVLAGFLKLVPEKIIERYRKKIINIHPALLPKYGGKGMYGMNVHEAVWSAGEKVTGITIHEVDEHFDNGDIIFQKSFPVSTSDTPETIRHKVHSLEMAWFPEIVAKKAGLL